MYDCVSKLKDHLTTKYTVYFQIDTSHRVVMTGEFIKVFVCQRKHKVAQIL